MTHATASQITLADILHPDRNSFSLVRLTMAVAVLVSHSYFFVSGTSAAEPLHDITGHSLGEHAVQVFFFLSGILVMQSFIKSGSLIDFATARALRIFPGLFVCVLVTALVLGPIVSNANPSSYFTSSALPSYMAKTLLLITGSAQLHAAKVDALVVDYMVNLTVKSISSHKAASMSDFTAEARVRSEHRLPIS